MKRAVEVVLFLIPFVGQLFFVGFANSVRTTVMGLPFFMFWWLLWMVLTPICTWLTYLIADHDRGERVS
ncbi:DUF3311 domain-containing protein [Alicyclobacillus cycloheptanicus]|jgi:hypothetical protein|uniref:DUF3311 domain-containing protein n=1 Tax=Alicyclobacillus cycloheptanicus TaxID=1457 RepID=A0ABT9XLY2_9BACL|nr:DUF3311 domain-containing protein [Alicyclobacillus cycloheptanicus]MDQ0191316.1 hypothetical protein [Alicyclobacillus cycloheptanicus]WDM00821.1 DUF3311 domain-containing protein [Alicyclobacillus cycloheptanicus]